MRLSFLLYLSKIWNKTFYKRFTYYSYIQQSFYTFILYTKSIVNAGYQKKFFILFHMAVILLFPPPPWTNNVTASSSFIEYFYFFIETINIDGKRLICWDFIVVAYQPLFCLKETGQKLCFQMRFPSFAKFATCVLCNFFIFSMKSG